MTTNKIVNILFQGSKELNKMSKGFKCHFNLYKCDLSRDSIYNLFEFEIDKSLSAFNPNNISKVVSKISRPAKGRLLYYSILGGNFG